MNKLEEGYIKKIEEIDERLKKVEDTLFSKDERLSKKIKEDFSGLAGGIRFLIKNGFFNEPKTLKEVIDELKREGYHRSISGVASTLSVTFTANQKILTRIKEEKTWKYVIRK